MQVCVGDPRQRRLRRPVEVCRIAGVEFINPDALSLDAFCVRRLTTSTAAAAAK
jgi:hypothetical protein